MTVNSDAGHGGRRTQAERSRSTRAALIQAARELFALKGFAATGREEIVERAGVTRGALYHHFDSKEGLFRAVFTDVERDLVAAVADAAATGRDPLERLHVGCAAFLDAAMDPAVQRIVLLDAPSVLGWQTWRELDAQFGLGLVRHALETVMADGLIERQPVDPLAHMLLAALNEGAMLIASASDPSAARADVGSVVSRLLHRL